MITLGVTRKRRPVVESPKEKPVPVRVLRVRAAEEVEAITFPGRVEARVDAVLAAEKSGRIVEILADKGERVAAGQALLRLDSRTWEALLRQAEIEKREADRDFERWQELERTGAVSASEMDAVRKRRDLAEATLAQALTAVSQCVVRSPMDGLVDDRAVEAGEYATEGMAVFRVVDVERVKVVADVPESQVFAVRTGMPLVVQAAVPEPAAFTGTVAFVSLVAQRESNTYRAEIVLDNRDHRLRPGFIVQVALPGRIGGPGVAVPLTAVVPKKGEHTVFLLRDGRAVRRLVRIQAIRGDEALVSTGLQADDEVVVDGQRALQDGAAVAVVE
jgi:membrane fusion protein (multidrug efflux system)